MAAKKTKERPGDWIVIVTSSRGQNAFATQCQRCRAVLEILLPVEVSVLGAASRAFRKIHKHCVEVK
jgi:hypothetical protein